MTSTAISATNLAKRYGRRPVLHDVDLTVSNGEVVALIGENGAGKSTLLRLCAGLLAPDAGSLVVRGRVGYCPQEPGVVDLLTADEHLALFATACGLRRREGLRRGRGILDDLGFPVGDRAVARDLSGGTRQKLNLALALLSDPSVLLLDEPYQGFDQGGYVDFWALVERWRHEGRAVVVVTHLLTELHRVDRALEVGGGALRPWSAVAS
jgi:ABC-2 type transport system ATP-binding protein